MSASFLSYVSVTFALVVTPGVTTAVVIQHALRHGRRAGASAAIGAACGNTTYALAAGLGLAVLVGQFPQVLAMLRVAGGLYLCWLAARGLRRAWLGSRAPDAWRSDPDVEHSPALRQGLTVTLLNPSIATFYLVVVPGFLPAPAGTAAFALLAGVHIGMALACHLLWALALGSPRTRLTGPTTVRTIDALTGVALLALGVRMLVV